MEKLTLYGAGWCPNSSKAKTFLKEHDIPFDYVNVDVSEHATDQIADYLTGEPVVPTLIWEGQAYPNPDEAQLAKLLGINPDYRIQMYGADWCPDCRRAKAFLRENQMNFQYIDVDQVKGATEKVSELNNGKRIIPTILINGVPNSDLHKLDGTVISNNSTFKLNRCMGYDGEIIATVEGFKGCRAYFDLSKGLLKWSVNESTDSLKSFELINGK